MKDGISICIPTFRRPQMLRESFYYVLQNPRVKEVVISDDCSGDGSFEYNIRQFAHEPKVKLFKNKSNVDCYRNKRQAVELATQPWVILLDDDNVIKPDYLDALWKYPRWVPSIIYCPDYAMPNFNYTHLAGSMVTKFTVAKMLNVSHFKCALNTCNYFLHRETYLACWSGSVNPHTADTMFHAYNHMSRGGALLFVPGLRYLHRIHEGSHYKNNHKKTGNFARDLEKMLGAMR